MPQSKLTPEDLYNIYLDTSPKIDQFAENLWNDYFNNSQSDLYLGQSYLEGLKRASIDLKAIGFMFDPNHNPEPLVQRYLEERGGKFITWLSNSGKKEFADLLIDAYTSTGSYEEFKKMFRDKYPLQQDWRSLMIWQTENNVAVNNASLYIYDQYKIPGFETILGPNPCGFCLTENMYTHRANENVPPFHIKCACTTRPVLIIEREKDPNSWKKFMSEKEKDRFQKNYENFNSKAKDKPLELKQEDMKKAIDTILERKEQSK